MEMPKENDFVDKRYTVCKAKMRLYAVCGLRMKQFAVAEGGGGLSLMALYDGTVLSPTCNTAHSVKGSLCLMESC